MSEGPITKVKIDFSSERRLKGDTDWERLRGMTDEEALQNALDDPDAQPLTPDQLSRMRRVPFPRHVRERLGMTQEDFAKTYGLALATLRDWEQGRSLPDQAARSFLTVIARAPDAVRDLLARR